MPQDHHPSVSPPEHVHGDTARDHRSLVLRVCTHLVAYVYRSNSLFPAPKTRKKVTIRALQQMFMTETPISVLTAYDYPSAK